MLASQRGASRYVTLTDIPPVPAMVRDDLPNLENLLLSLNFTAVFHHVDVDARGEPSHWTGGGSDIIVCDKRTDIGAHPPEPNRTLFCRTKHVFLPIKRGKNTEAFRLLLPIDRLRFPPEATPA